MGGGPIVRTSALAGRQARADPWPYPVLAVVVLLVAFLATITPRFLSDVSTRQVEHVTGELSTIQRDVSAGSLTRLSLAVADADRDDLEAVTRGLWSSGPEGLERIRARQPEPLRSVLHPGWMLVTVREEIRVGSGVGAFLAMRIDPDLTNHADLVSGEWPPATVTIPFVDNPPVPVALPQDVASRLDWQVGDEQNDMVLTGTFAATDPDDRRWASMPTPLELEWLPTDGGGWQWFGTAYLATDASGYATDEPRPTVHLQYGFPLQLSDVSGQHAQVVAAQLRGMASTEHLMTPSGTFVETDVRIRLASELVPVLETLGSQYRAATAIVGIMAAGPLGMTIAVFLLGARLLTTRRTPAMRLARARGASDQQLRTLLAVEAAAVAVPATLAGYLIGRWVAPAGGGWPEMLLLGLIAVLPVLAMATTPYESPTDRRPTSRRSKSRRALAEALVVGVTALSVWQLLRWGAAETAVESAGPADGAATWSNLLLVSTSLMVALSGCLLTLRLLPPGLRLLTRLLRRRPGVPAFLGVARSARDPAGGWLPVLSVVLGLSVAVTAIVLASTVTHGGRTAAWESAGGQIRVSGPQYTPELIAEIEAVDGVAGGSAIRIADSHTRLTGAVAHSGPVAVVVVDDDIGERYDQMPFDNPLPDRFFEVISPVPVLTGGAVTADEGLGNLDGTGQVTVLDHLAQLPGARTPSAYVAISRGNWEAAGAQTPPASMRLLHLEPGADLETVAAAVGEVPRVGEVRTAAGDLGRFQSAPLVSGLTQAFTVAALVSTLLTVVAVLVVQQLGTPGRIRSLSLLRTMGMGPRQGRRLTAWELGPVLLSAVLTGVIVGLAVPMLLLRAIDLRGITGGATQPELVLEVPLLASLVGLVTVLLALAVTVTAVLASRSDLAQQVRVGEFR